MSFNATSVGLDMRALSVLAHAIDEGAGERARVVRVGTSVFLPPLVRAGPPALFKLAVIAGRPGCACDDTERDAPAARSPLRRRASWRISFCFVMLSTPDAKASRTPAMPNRMNATCSGPYRSAVSFINRWLISMNESASSWGDTAYGASVPLMASIVSVASLDTNSFICSSKD